MKLPQATGSDAFDAEMHRTDERSMHVMVRSCGTCQPFFAARGKEFQKKCEERFVSHAIEKMPLPRIPSRAFTENLIDGSVRADKLIRARTILFSGLAIFKVWRWLDD